MQPFSTKNYCCLREVKEDTVIQNAHAQVGGVKHLLVRAALSIYF